MNNRNNTFKVGQIVQIPGKQLEGRIAYIGVTNFAPGRWIGVVLNEERGKNNGQVKGTTYFKCPKNYGIFVRPTQLIMKKTNVTEEMPRMMMEQQQQTKSKPQATTQAQQLPTPPPQQQQQLKAQPAKVGLGGGGTISQVVVLQRELTATTIIPPAKATVSASCGSTAITQLPPKSLTSSSMTLPPRTDDKNSLVVKKVAKMPTSTNLLKTTKINQPKEVTPLQPSTSQVSLHNIAGPLRNLRPPLALAPKRSKTSMSPSESFCCAKRSSFVETGFLEILRPQFTPGQPIRSPTFSSMALNSSSSHNLQDLKQQQKQLESRLKELEEEIEQLKSQKSDDKRKLQGMERLRLQNEQLLEFKVRIMDQQSNLQRELTRLRQELREAQESQSKYQRDLDEAAENIELLTLDKEMAEERAETLQLELELAQEQCEELTLDVEILKAENERYLCGSDNSIAPMAKDDNLSSHGEIKKLEQYNQRLRETVIKLRDVLTEEKQQSMKAFKELETKNSEILELKKTKELLTQRCDVMETHIIDLREQVDAALGAETMVATLADAKLELEDRVRLLEEEVSELEALEEIHEQLIESNQELERDLREEIELLNTNIRTLQQEKDSALETVYERDCTIMKFRNLVKTLNERDQIKEQMALTTVASTTATASTSEELNSISSNQEFMPGVDFQQIFASTKAYGRALELQLATVELKMVQLQNEYLKAFLPEELMLRGGAYDVILILVVLQRCMEKIDIICSGIHEKFPASCEFGRDAIFEGYSVHRFAFRTRCLYLLRSLKMILQQLDFGLNHCDYEICTHAAIYRGEMEAQEKQLDDLLRLLKKGLLDENTPVDSLERASSFYNSLLNNLFASQNLAELFDEQKLYASLIEVYDVALDCVNTHAGLLYTIIQLGDEQTDSFCSMQFLMEHVRAFKVQLKQLQRKIPSKTISFSSLQWPQLQRLHERNDYLGRLIDLLSSTAREATKDIANTPKNETSAGGNDIATAIDHERLWRIIHFNCNKMAPEGYQKSPVDFFQNAIAILQEQLDEFQQFIKESEKALSINLNTTYVRSEDLTILQQANEVKKHYEEIKLLHHHLGEKDKEIKSLKYMAKMKQNDYSELQIRKDMAEKHLHKQQQDYTELMHQISEKMEDLLEDLQNQQIKLLNTLDNNSHKLERLERVQDALKQCVNNSSQTHTSCSHDSLREIENLSLCLRQQREQNIALQSKFLREELKKLAPLHVPKHTSDQRLEEEIKTLSGDLTKLKKAWILGYITLNTNTTTPGDVNSGKVSPSRRLHSETSHLTQHILDTYYRTHPHRQIATDFGQFASKEMQEIFK
ncbi:dynactin subunit 1 [Stomoxys calcitrans]|uniref:dynactin subunit 1 n=1 Tax=Stomoxys calcitrans TaxID=35570 RepID=UPI0027E3758F|nr:dynactin subunit 1 [Stomoxys calcitrans]